MRLILSRLGTYQGSAPRWLVRLPNKNIRIFKTYKQALQSFKSLKQNRS